MSDTTVSLGPGGRTAGGRFAAGNKFSLGNANARRMHELRRALLESATPEAVREVGLKLVELARAGDVQAARLWLEHCCGKPVQAVELSGPDGAPLGGDLETLRAVVLGALDRHPEARIAVAAALLRFRSSADGPADDAGP
jgi:hypothetical protein